ncbi:MAG: hypothetical protein HDR53_06755 [Treponema sp.]|nr:hypothetical protein [Treponema sp.]
MISKTDAQKKRNSERIRNSVCTVLACAALLLAQSCTNVVHELIPPSDSGIHSFSVENTDRTRYRAAETDSTDITITVPAGTDITSLVPIIELDPKSAVIPVTLPYIHRAFPSADLMSLAVQMNASQKAGDLANWMLNFIRENKDFSVPPLDEPIDFTQPVMFCVIAGRGNYKLYTVTVVQEKTENPSTPENPSPSKPDDPYDPGTPSKPSDPTTAECEKKILSFVVNEPKQAKPSVITEDSVKFYLNAGADRSALYPVITVSKGAGILPLTQEYLLKLFSYTELISFYSGFSSAKDINAFISATVKKLDADKIAKIMEADLSLPIDFSGFNGLFGLVPFAVIGADKTAHVYYISCVTTEDTAALTAFAVTKIRNPGLMGDADISINGDAVTITATYPVEYPNFKLIPDIVIEGDTWEITNGTLRTENVGTSSEEAEYTAGLKKAIYLVPNDAYPVGNEYTATLTVRRGEAAAAYTLRLIYQEDPDTIRSITDFRFLRLRNPGIKTSAMASISKSEDTGFISATVLYEGDNPPYDLVADFYSPGICTVEHVEQVSGRSRNNFQYDVYILCTSKNKLFCRLYTVHITFIKVKTAEAVLNYFSFPKHLNPDLSQSATGLIDESSGTVYISAKYHTPEKPARLVPEFAATGIVSVNSILQSSGYSAQDFSRSVYYSVRDQNDWSSDSRTYRISVNWEQDEQSACAITSFGFSTADNPSLEKEVSARINERSGTIYALLPKGAGKSNLVPYFSAQGTVTIDSAEQISGSSRLDFSNEVIYTVTSANGLYSKQYAVSVQEAGPVIYVNAAAIGRNNGTCWQDAYITLDAAFEQAEAYGDTPKEIWIAYNGGETYTPLSDAYRQNGLPLTANTAIRGGFDGTETDADDRRTKQRKIEFDVNAVENANDNKRKTIPIRHEAAVCAVQTKLYMTDDDTSLYFFSTSASTGEIMFDGIEMEQKKNGLFDKTTDALDVIFSDCTVRCISVTRDRCNLSIENCDFYTRDLYGKSINVVGSNFKPTTVYQYINLQHEDSLSLEKCVFQAEPKLHYQVILRNVAAPTRINSCFFDTIYFRDNYNGYSTNRYFINCLFSFDSSFSSSLNVTEIICCELKNMSEAYRSDISFSHLNNAIITDSIIEGFNLTPNNTKLSVTNSIFQKSSFNNNLDTCEIEMTKTTMEETGRYLISSYSQTASITVLLKDCTFSDSSTSSNTNYIDLNSTNSNIDIDDCTFNIHASSSLRNVGSTKINNSNFLCKSANIFSINTDGTTEITNTTFENKDRILLNLTKSSNQSDTETIFTGNTLKGQQFIQLEAHNIKKLEKNNYDTFVIYKLNSPLNNTSIDFSTEKITIKEPLYCNDNTKCTKKAYLSLSNGKIRIIDDEKYKDFLCGLSLTNASAIVKGLEFGKIPSFCKLNPLSGSGDMLELTDCTIESTNESRPMSISFTNTTLKNCTVKGTLNVIGHDITVSKSSPIGDITSNDGTVLVSENSTVGNIYEAKTIIAKNSNITGSITGKNGQKSEITLEGVTVDGVISSLGNNSSVHTSASNGNRTKILGTSIDYSIFYSSIDCSGEISCTDTDMTGGIWGGDKITTKNAKIGGFITFNTDAKIEFSKSHITALYSDQADKNNKAYEITILGSTVENIYLYSNTNEQASLSTDSIDGIRSIIHQIKYLNYSDTGLINFSFYNTDFDSKNEKVMLWVIGNDITISNCTIQNYISVYDCTHSQKNFPYEIKFYAHNKLDINSNTTFCNNYGNFYKDPSISYDTISYEFVSPIILYGQQISIDHVIFFDNRIITDINNDENLKIQTPIIRIYHSTPNESSNSISIKYSTFSYLTCSPATAYNSFFQPIYIDDTHAPSSIEISNCTFSNNINYDAVITTHCKDSRLSISNCTTDKSKSLKLYFATDEDTVESSHVRILKAIDEGTFKTDNTLPLCF